jgi:hypothetical protein
VIREKRVFSGAEYTFADRIGDAPDENHFTMSRADEWGYNGALLEVKKEIPNNTFAGKLGHENLTFGAQCCDTES